MEKLLNKYGINDKTIAVGVSGGADSLALALMATAELKKKGYNIVALTIDHGLRPTSHQEAEYVAKIMAQNGIEHHILPWLDAKPKTGVEEAARIARYRLIREWCCNNGVNCVLMAHHLRDQAETFLMRLQRGSGLNGLCAMREIEFINDLIILRPLLRTNPEDLRTYLRQHHIKWIEDESNDDERYLRNKIRKFLPLMKEEIGISAENLAATVERLQGADDYIQGNILEWISGNVFYELGDIQYFSLSDFLLLHSEVQFRIISEFLRQRYIPRAASILNLLQNLRQPEFKGATLGKKEFLIYGGKVWIVPELDIKRKSYRAKWKNFCKTHPEYAEKKIPHKAKFAMISAWSNK